MIEYEAVYAARADEYDQLVMAEDSARALERFVTGFAASAGDVCIEVGCGTGRLTRWIARTEKPLSACDAAPAMLRHAKLAAEREGWGDRVDFAVADARALPYAEGTADLVVAGWVIGHFVDFFGEQWPQHAGRAVVELKRIVRAGGKIMLVETMGTGTDRPRPPTSGHDAYYKWLHDEHGFSSAVLRTDYEFGTMHHGGALVRMFFGSAVADAMVASGTSRLVEYTGVWTASV
jgi:ubiquinone/menaquinone biosynthesis C-methylase UbiE